ncbi:MAG TPA: pyridoxal-phosphate dependent enzyme [Candidatus Micrarchaeaceae archaeon]|nr:pyridoxal-phosphate dependent enzyme [Candidatus Micrarchaeaceae archaeon]
MRTPLVRLNMIDAPGEIFLKLENLQPVGAFKTRGASFAMSELPTEELARGVLTASAGNMAQAVAYGARQMGISCTVIAPDTAPQTKLDGIRRLGGKVIWVSFDRWWQTLIDRGFPGIDGAFIHPFDDLNVMAGNGTIGLEILEDLPGVDTILVPWGGGGLAIGIAAAVQDSGSACKVIAVEVETGAPLAASLKKGQPVIVPYQATFIDGIGSKSVLPNMFKLAQRFLAGSLVATVEETAAAVRLIVERNRVVPEGAGAVALAVALSGRAGTGQIACIVSGGNIDSHKLAVILEGGTP